MTQRIIWYEPLTYQQLGADSDIQTYHEFRSAFDNLATACRARRQSFEKICIDISAMLVWLRDNGHKNDDAGRATFSCLMCLPKHHEEEICNGPV